MTCIVGKIDKKKNKVYIGADSAGVDGLDITIRKDVKVFKVDEFIIMAKQNQYFPQSVPHPGETLAEKLEEMEMPKNEFALRTGKPEKTIIAIVNGKSSITPDMAVQFENVTKIPANFWMNHQRGYDEYIAREKRPEGL